jgi:hypothetical protein
VQLPNRRSSAAFSITLLACGIGWILLPYTPSFMPGEPLPGKLALLQRLFTWWPLALLAAFAIGLALPKLDTNGVARRILLVMQWLLTFASIVLIAVALFEVLFPRPF